MAQRLNDDCSLWPVVQPGHVGPSERVKKTPRPLGKSQSSGPGVTGSSQLGSSRKFRFHWEVLGGTSDVERREPGCILKGKNWQPPCARLEESISRLSEKTPG